MSRRRPRRGSEGPEQLILPPTPAPPKARGRQAPEQAAKKAIARRAKPSAVPGYVKLVVTLDIPRVLAEQLSAQAIREGKNLEAVVMERLGHKP